VLGGQETVDLNSGWAPGVGSVNRQPNSGDATVFGLRMLSPAARFPVWIHDTRAENADDSSLTFYNDMLSTDFRTLFIRDLVGFVVIFPEGIATSLTMDVFPVTVSTVAKQQTNSAAATIQVGFVITSVPAVDLAVPTV